MLAGRGAAVVASQCWSWLQQTATGAPAAASFLQAGVHTSSALRSCSGSGHSAQAAPSNASPWVARLASRSIICLEGPEALVFLQGMVTNDVRPLASPGAGPVYAALVNPKGKLLHDLFIFRGVTDDTPGDAVSVVAAPLQRLWLDVDAAGASDVLQWLSRYKLRRAVRLEAAGDEFSVWARHHQNGGASSNNLSSSSSSSSSSSNSEASTSSGTWHEDPRLPGGALGERGVFAAAGPAVAAATGGGWQVVGEAAHRLLRYQQGVPEGDREMPSERTTPLELNLDALNGISYTKGCYIGQERNSYTHFRGIVRRRVMPVEIAPETQLQPGTQLMDPTSGAAVGVLLASEGPAGLAHLRLAPALLAAAPAAPPLRAGGDAWARPVRPGWWPEEWGREEEGAAPSVGAGGVAAA